MTELEEILGNSTALLIIKYLSNRREGETGRKIASAINLSPQTTLKALNELVKRSLVHSTKVGNAYLYQLNQNHWFIKEGLTPLWSKISNWKKLLGKHYADQIKPKPISIILFGSYARGDKTENSDFDLLFLFKDQKTADKTYNEILKLEDSIISSFGVTPSIKSISIKQFQKEVKKDLGLMRTIFREGESLYGPSLSEIINYDSKKN